MPGEPAPDAAPCSASRAAPDDLGGEPACWAHLLEHATIRDADGRHVIGLRRLYEPVARSDGTRILVDRLWPRGVSRADARVTLWWPDLAPSTELRRWYGHDQVRWPQFVDRYLTELDTLSSTGGVVDTRLTELCQHLAAGPVTLVHAARDEQHSHALVLRAYLAEALRQHRM